MRMLADVFLTGLLVAGLVGCRPGSGDSMSVRAVVDTGVSVHIAGDGVVEARVGERIERAMVIENRNPTRIEAYGLELGCGCQSVTTSDGSPVTASMVIAIEASQRVSLTLVSIAQEGRKSYRVAWRLRGAIKERVECSMYIFGTRLLRVSPAVLDLGRMTDPISVQCSLRVSRVDGETLSNLQAIPSSDCVRVLSLESGSSKDCVEVVAQVLVGGRGRLAESLTLVDGDEHLIVPIMGAVAEDIELLPRVVLIRRVNGEGEGHVAFKCRPGVSIRELLCPPGVSGIQEPGRIVFKIDRNYSHPIIANLEATVALSNGNVETVMIVLRTSGT